MVLGLAPGPEPRCPQFPALRAVRDRVPVLVAGNGAVGVVGDEVGAGRVEEQQVGLKTRQLGDPAEDLLLQGAADLQQPVHRPVTGVVARRVKVSDQHLLARPAGRGQLRGRGQRPVGGQREQHPLRRRVQAAALQQPPHRRADAQPFPQRVEHPGAAQRAGLRELQALRRDRAGLPGLQVTGDGGDQPLEGLPGPGLLPAEVVDDLHPRPLRGRVPHVMGQLQVADLAAVLVPARRRPQVHILEITPLHQLSPGLIASLHVSMNLAPQQCQSAAWPARSPRNAD